MRLADRILHAYSAPPIVGKGIMLWQIQPVLPMQLVLKSVTRAPLLDYLVRLCKAMSSTGQSAGGTHHSEITDALTAFRPRRIQRYASVNVLLLYWIESDLKRDGELDQLQQMFGHVFNYSVHRFPIPSERPQARLNSYIARFLEAHAEKDDLVILYYGGHGGPTRDSRIPCEWAAYDAFGDLPT